MQQEPDPYTLVQNSLQKMVSNSNAFKRLVKDVNFIAFNTNDKQPIRTNPQRGNLPEVLLQCIGNSEGNLQNSTTSTRVRRQYQFVVSTGDLRINELLNPIEFAIMAAVTNWCEELVKKVTWKNQLFVKAVRFVNSQVGMSDSQLNRGIEGWTSISTFEVEMYFKTSDLKGLN